MQNTDRTEELRGFFESARLAAPKTLATFTTCVRADSFLESIRLISRTAHEAMSRCTRRIDDTLQAIDGCTPTMSSVERKLLLSETELVAASTSVTNFTETVDNAIEVLRTKVKRSNRYLRRQQSAAASAELSVQLLEHYKALLQCLGQRISKCRMRMALCKEEVALYKNEMVYFGCNGVLSCSVPNTVQTVDPTPGLASPVGGARSSAAEAISQDRAHFGIVQASRNTMQLVDGVLKIAAETVKLAGDSAMTIARAGNVSLGRNLRTEKSTDASQMPTVPHFDFSPEEKHRLSEQSVSLQLRQREASAHDAKMVEASVRDLSQLTSLMNEKVMEQAEQFSILVQNTAETRELMKRAVEELRKPTNRFWNSTRQLIALLWICTAITLVTNWIVR